MGNDKIVNEVEGLLRDLFKFGTAFRQRARRRLHENNYDLSPEQIVTLINIKEGDHLTMTEIAERMVRDKTTLTRMTENLEKMGLVEKITDPNDRRQIFLKLTDSGLNRLKQIQALNPTMGSIAANNLTYEQVKVTRKTISTMIGNFLNEK